jgi:hypothetical protein
MTTAAAVELLDVHPNTIYNMIRRGDLEVVDRIPRQGRPALLLDGAAVRRLAKQRHPSNREKTRPRIGSGSSTSTTAHGRPDLTAVPGSRTA